MTPKKKCLRTAFILIAVAVVFVIVAVCAFAIFNSAVIGVIAILFIAFPCFIMGFSYLKDASCLYCPKCGEKYNYDNVRWEVSNTNEKEKSVVAEVDFEVRCSHCGAERQYTRNYTVSYIDSNGKLHNNNLQNIIRKQFKCK